MPGVQVQQPAAVYATREPENQKKQYDNIRHFVVSHPSMNLIEVSILEETNKPFPKFFAIIMFVPGKPDNTKQSGRTYAMNEKKFIKYSIEELFEIAYALEEAAAVGQSQYIKFADTSKFKGGEKQVKKVSVTAVNNGGQSKVYLNYKDDTASIATTFTKYAAIGFAGQIKAIASEAQIMYSKMLANRGQQ